MQTGGNIKQNKKHSHRHHAHHDHMSHSGLNAGTETAKYLNKAFIIGIILNLAFVAVEFIAGLIIGSLALISDAGHNLSDVVSLGLALLAFKLAKKKPSEKYTYGHKKSTVVVSLTNACILLIAVGIIIYESIEKITDPHPVSGGAVAWVAGVGIIINGFTTWLFLRHKDTDLNVKGAYLHMAADTLVSVGVVISGLIIKFTGWYPLDPIISILIAIVILISTWGLLKDSIRLSLDGVPPGIEPNEVSSAMLSADHRIKNVHHMHIWALSTTENALTAHIEVCSMENTEEIKKTLKQLLAREYGIGHATLEFELYGGGEYCSCK